MKKPSCVFRPIRREEHQETEMLAREAFWNLYRPGCQEHYILRRLRSDESYLPEMDFVLEKDGQLIGQCILFPSQIAADGGGAVPVLTLGPICIHPAHTGRGHGKALLDYALGWAAAYGARAVLLEGDPGFYSKSGFVPASDFGIRLHGLPQDADAGFFLCRELVPGCLEGLTGEYADPPVYLADQAEVDRFDAVFPPKEKKTLPGQLF